MSQSVAETGEVKTAQNIYDWGRVCPSRWPTLNNNQHLCLIITNCCRTIVQPEGPGIRELFIYYLIYFVSFLH